MDTMHVVDKKRVAHQALIRRILEGEGKASRVERRAAFENGGFSDPLRTLIDKVAENPTRITDEDIANVEASGKNEDEIFEFVVCAAIGQATRQYETALEALEQALADATKE